MKLLAAATSILLTFFTTVGLAQAQGYPVRTVRIVVPYPSGSGPDMFARVLAQQLQESLGRPFVIDNKAGALGIIGTTDVSRSTADGYTLLLTTNTTQAANLALVKNLPYNPVKDFEPIVRVVSAPMVLLVKPEFPALTMKEFIAHAKSRTEGLSGGYGSAASQVSIAKLKTLGGFSAIEVPYKGIPPAVNDLLGGQISFTFADLPLAMPLIRSGKLKGMGVTSLKRLTGEPSLPAIAEEFPGFEVIGWQGLVAPAGTPKDVINKLYETMVIAMTKPEVRARIISMHQDIEVLNPEQFSKFIEREILKWSKDAKEAGIEPQ